MKVSYKMLKDLNMCCHAGEQFFHEYYIKERGFEEDTGENYFDLYENMSNSFDNGYFKEKGIEFDFDKAGTLKLLRRVRYSPEAILYYPENVIYPDEFRLTTPVGIFVFDSLQIALDKKNEIKQSIVDKNSLYERYAVSEISVRLDLNGNKTIKILKSITNDKELKTASRYIFNTRDGNRIEVHGKDALVKALEEEYRRELLSIESLFKIERKVQETIDNFYAWIPVV